MEEVKIRNIVNKFNIEGEFIDITPFGSGNINNTFLVVTSINKYILQRINSKVFTKPLDVISNSIKVTTHIKNKLVKEGNFDSRKVLSFIKTKDNQYYYLDNNDYYRMSLYVENSISIDVVDTKEHFLEAGHAFGSFQRLLSDFDSSSLKETIKDFHNTRKRYEHFIEVVNKNEFNRNEEVQDEIDYLINHKYLLDSFNNFNIPIRVTHNDTKINNVLFDKDTSKALCVIDLDTVMPGTILSDFGDAIRSGCNSSTEDEVDLSKVHFKMELYEVFTKGFLEETKDILTKDELDLLYLSPLLLTYELALRFLSDYLEGDIYFKTTRLNQNLDRTRTQIKLIKEMEEHLSEMKDIINKYR